MRPSEARVKRSYEDKITFSHAYRTQFFHTTCAKLDLAHAVLLERAQSNTLRTECEKIMFQYMPENVPKCVNIVRKLVTATEQRGASGRDCIVHDIGGAIFAPCMVHVDVTRSNFGLFGIKTSLI